MLYRNYTNFSLQHIEKSIPLIIYVHTLLHALFNPQSFSTEIGILHPGVHVSIMLYSTKAQENTATPLHIRNLSNWYGSE